VMAHSRLQLNVLTEVLCEDPDVLTLEALARRVLPNPRSLTGSIALAHALQKLRCSGPLARRLQSRVPGCQVFAPHRHQFRPLSPACGQAGMCPRPIAL
jgi:hypothetical protein